MEDIVAGERRGAAPKGVSPRPWRVALRPFGYLLVGLTWLAIWALVVALGWGILAFGVIAGNLTVAEFTEPATASVGAFIGMVFLAAPLLAVIAGPVVLWWLPNCSWPLALLSFVYVARSLNPAYRHEKLSFTASGVRGSVIGPPTATDVALSLQPVRNTTLTRFLMRFYVAGWQASGPWFLAMLPAGVGWLLLFPAIAADVSEATNVVCGVLGTGLIVWSYAWALRIAWRQTSPAKDTSGPSR
ncbi:hypothetical protein GCM10027063_45540 [Promicromonospora xylanilytica]